MKRYLLRNPRGLQRRKAMNVIMVGCESAGKTTLADLIVEWCERNLGGSSHFHTTSRYRRRS